MMCVCCNRELSFVLGDSGELASVYLSHRYYDMPPEWEEEEDGPYCRACAIEKEVDDACMAWLDNMLAIAGFPQRGSEDENPDDPCFFDDEDEGRQ